MKPFFTTLLAFAASAAFCLAQLPDFGAQTKRPDAETRKSLELKKNNGLEVTNVFPDSAAERLGLEEGDIVTHLGKRPVKSTTGLSNLIGAIYDVGEELTLKWKRDGRDMTGKVELKESATEEEFAKRYEAGPKAAKGANGANGLAELFGGAGGIAGIQGGAFMIGPDGKLVPLDDENLDDLDFGADLTDEEIEEMKKQGIDPEDMQKELQKALGGLNLEDLIGQALAGGGAGGIVQMSTVMQTENGSIDHSVKPNGKHRFHIKDKDGEKLFKGSITPEEIEKIPEAFREDAKMLMEQDLDIEFDFDGDIDGDGIINELDVEILGGDELKPGKDLDDLLEKIGE